MKKKFALLASVILPLACPMPGVFGAVIENVVETGGDNEATDTITAKWTGQSWNTTVNNEPLPNIPAGTPFTLGTFGHQSPAFVDRNHRYSDDLGIGSTIPAYLVGEEYIMSGNDNRDNASYQLDVTISVRSKVYMLIDNRLSDGANGDPPTFDATHMQWILDEGWAPTANGLNRFSDPNVPDEVAFDEGADNDIDQWFSVYEKEFPAGTFTLFQPDNEGRNMYGVVVAPVDPANVSIRNFGAAPLSIAPGGESTLSWTIHTGATSAVIDQGVGNVLPLTTGGIGTTAVSPTVDTTYTLSVNSPAGPQNSAVTVAVQLVLEFQSDAVTFINPGAPALLSWRVRPGATVSISGIGNVGGQTGPDGIGSITVNPLVGTTYVLTASGSGRQEQAIVRVPVTPTGQTYALIDIGGTGGQVEPGAAGEMVVGAGGDGTNLTDLLPVTLTSDTGDEFSIAIDNLDPSGTPTPNNGLDWRDRGDAPATPLAFLAEDLVKNNEGMIHVTLGGLPAGTYDVISFHIDPNFSQAANIRILVTDANRVAEDTNVLGDASFPGHPSDVNIPTVGGLTTPIVDMKGARFQITSNGTDDVMIYFDAVGNPIDDEVPLAGLWLMLPPSEGFDVVNIARAVGGGSASVTIEFESTPGRTYTIRTSPDFIDWNTVLNNNVPASAGATTIFTEANIPLNIRNRYYRVDRN